jgi:hypothetical protein
MMLNILLLVGVLGDDIVASTGPYDSQLEPEFTDELAGSADRRLAEQDAQKDAATHMAIHTLQKMHKAQKMFDAYKKEKERLERRAIVSYLVGGVFLLLFAGGVVWQIDARYILCEQGIPARGPAVDEESLVPRDQRGGAGGSSAAAAMAAVRVKPADEQRLMGPDNDDEIPRVTSGGL